MLEVAGLVVSIAHCLILVVNVLCVLYLCPNEVGREILADLDHLAVLAGDAEWVVNLRTTVELQCIWNLTEVPSRTICECARAALRTLAASLDLLASGLACSSLRRSVSIKPYTYRSVSSVRISHHWRIEFAVLKVEHLVADTCILWCWLRTDREANVSIFLLECLHAIDEVESLLDLCLVLRRVVAYTES